MEYKIISKTFSVGMTKAINEALSEGWELQGGVCFGNEMFHQAMVRYATINKLNMPKFPEQEAFISNTHGSHARTVFESMEDTQWPN